MGHEQELRLALQAGRARSVTAVLHHSRIVQRQDTRLLTAQMWVRILPREPNQMTEDGGRTTDVRGETYLSSVVRHPSSDHPSIAQLAQSTWLRARRSQVRVLLDGPIISGRSAARQRSWPGTRRS